LSRNSIDLINLDQQELLNSFKQYLRTQDEFKDYDFNGSAMNVLLDLLAVNTFRNAFYLNMTFSERWIDSAQLRTSLFSHAKTLNYLPRSVRSSKARVRINFTATGDNQPYLVQKGSQFSTLVKSESFTFTIPESIVVSSADGNFEFETDLYEGIYQKDSYIFAAGSDLQRFRITNRNVDTRSLTVTVFEDGKEIGDIYKLQTTLLGLKPSSKVFFLQTSETGYYEIIFGDNVVGRRPKENSIIILDYRISRGADSNGAKSFSVDFDPTSRNELTSTPELEVIEASANGEAEESNESIRYFAPRHFQVQERGVISSDYEILLKTQFPEINNVAVFGGEEIDPPQFGKVFIAVNISGVTGLPETKADEYKEFIKGRSLFGVEAEFIESEYLYLYIENYVRYNINVTTNSENRIRTIVKNAIVEFNKDFLNGYNVIMRNSILNKEISEADESIVSSKLVVWPYKIFTPRLGVNASYRINFDTKIINNLPKQLDVYPIADQKAVTSSVFTYNNSNCKIEDDGDGKLRIVRENGDVAIKIVDIGTVDYDTGIIQINNLNVAGFDGRGIRIYITPEDEDIRAIRNNIMSIVPDDINITVEAIRE